MTDARWKELMESNDLPLTKEEIAEGWHWCNEFDGLLIGPEDGAMECCTCKGVDKTKYLEWKAKQPPVEIPTIPPF